MVRRPRPGRACRRLQLIVLAALAIVGCQPAESEPEPDPATLVPTEWADPDARLAELFQAGAVPGEVPVVDRYEAEALVRRMLPDPTSKLDTAVWKPVYLDLPGADAIVVELLDTPAVDGPRGLFTVLTYYPERTEARTCPENDSETHRVEVAGFPACELDGHDVTVFVGRIEILAVAASESWEEPGALRSLLESFPLQRLASM